jgi:spermidine/putrescine-binding protein
MGLGWVKESDTFKLSQKNIDNGWKTGKEEFPESNSWIVMHYYYDGPNYQTIFVDSDRKYWFNGLDVESDFTDKDLNNSAWKYIEPFDLS